MNYRRIRSGLSLIAAVCALAFVGEAQETSASVPSAAATTTSAVPGVVPRIVNFSGTLTDVTGKPITALAGVTFTLYQDAEGGMPLWMEIQNVQPGKNGRYSVTLGSTTSTGLPQDLFVTGEARWLGVQVEGQPTQPRALLVAVPYALKAGDAETVGGLPASAFVLANSAEAATGRATAAVSAGKPNSAKSAVPANADVTGLGTVNYVPLWNTTSDIVDSVIFQKASTIGIGTTTPAATLDVNGKGVMRDTLTLFPKSTDNTLAVNGTAFKVSSTGAVTFVSGQIFPGAGTITGVATATGSGLSGGGTSGTLSLKVPAAGITNAMLQDSKITLNANTAGGLTVPGAMTLGSTYTIGLKPCTANQVLQYNGTAWACASAGSGTITGVTAGTDLTGGGTSGNVTLSLNTTSTDARYAQLGAANKFTASQTVTGTLTATSFSGNGSALTNVTATNSNELGGLASSDYALLNTINSANNSGAVLNVSQAGTSGFGVAATSAFIGISGSGLYGVDGVSSTSYGIGSYGLNTSATGQSIGVEGSSASSNGFGVFGVGTTGVYGSGTDSGIEGVTSSTVYAAVSGAGSGLGVYGSGAGGAGTNGGQSGVWGDTGDNSGNTIAVRGTAGSATAGGFYNNSDSYPAVWAVNAGDGYGLGAEGGFAGIYSSASGSSQEGETVLGSSGVWGDTAGQSGLYSAILGTADNNIAGAFANNSDNISTLSVWNDESASSFGLIFDAYSTEFNSECFIEVSGNLGCTGQITDAVSVDGGTRKVALYSMQSPENWFEDAGSGLLSNGSARIVLDATFAQTVNAGIEYHVFLTPNDDCKGLYVSQKSAGSFEVHELGGGTSSIAFDYRIMAKRAGFETVRLADLTQTFKQQEANHQRMRHAGRPHPAVRPAATQPAPPVTAPPLSPRLPLRAAATAATPRPQTATPIR